MLNFPENFRIFKKFISEFLKIPNLIVQFFN
jgi:hypothetical protein